MNLILNFSQTHCLSKVEYQYLINLAQKFWEHGFQLENVFLIQKMPNVDQDYKSWFEHVLTERFVSVDQAMSNPNVNVHQGNVLPKVTRFQQKGLENGRKYQAVFSSKAAKNAEKEKSPTLGTVSVELMTLAHQRIQLNQRTVQ